MKTVIIEAAIESEQNIEWILNTMATGKPENGLTARSIKFTVSLEDLQKEAFKRVLTALKEKGEKGAEAQIQSEIRSIDFMSGMKDLFIRTESGGDYE